MFTFGTFSRHLCPKQPTIRTFVTIYSGIRLRFNISQMHFLFPILIGLDLKKGFIYIYSICDIVYRNNLSINCVFKFLLWISDVSSMKLVSPEQNSAFCPHVLYFMMTPRLIILIHHLHNIRKSMLSSADLNFSCRNLCWDVAALDAEFI